MEKREVVVPSDLPIVCLILIGLGDNLGLCYLFFKVTKSL